MFKFLKSIFFFLAALSYSTLSIAQDGASEADAMQQHIQDLQTAVQNNQNNQNLAPITQAPVQGVPLHPIQQIPPQTTQVIQTPAGTQAIGGPINPWLRPNPWHDTVSNPWSNAPLMAEPPATTSTVTTTTTTPATSATTSATTVKKTQTQSSQEQQDNSDNKVPNIYSPGKSSTSPTNIYK